MSIEDVARNLRIRRPYIDAIEHGRFEQLPGAAYIPAFLRAYARHIGLDPAKVLTAYQLSGSVPIERPVALPADFPLTERRAPIGLFVLTVLLVVGAGYGVWHYLPRQQGVVAEKVPPVPDRLLASPRPANEAVREVARAQAPVSPPAPSAAPVVEAVSITPAPQAPAPQAPIVQSAPPQASAPQPARDMHMWPAPRQEAQVPPPPPPAVIAVPAAPPPAVMAAPSAGQALAAQPPAIETQRNNTPASVDTQEAVARPAPPETRPMVPPTEPVARAVPVENAENAAPPSAPTRADTQIMVRANSWVELRSAAGDVLAQTYVRAGESYIVPAGIAYRIIDAAR